MMLRKLNNENLKHINGGYIFIKRRPAQNGMLGQKYYQVCNDNDPNDYKIFDNFADAVHHEININGANDADWLNGNKIIDWSDL